MARRHRADVDPFILLWGPATLWTNAVSMVLSLAAWPLLVVVVLKVVRPLRGGQPLPPGSPLSWAGVQWAGLLLALTGYLNVGAMAEALSRAPEPGGPGRAGNLVPTWEPPSRRTRFMYGTVLGMPAGSTGGSRPRSSGGSDGPSSSPASMVRS
jgi:hypothetical protein